MQNSAARNLAIALVSLTGIAVFCSSVSSKPEAFATPSARPTLAADPSPAHSAYPQSLEPGRARLVACSDIAVPYIKVQGMLQSSRGSFALIRTPNCTYQIQEGGKIGDYDVQKVSDHKVVLGLKGITFAPYKMTGSTSSGKLELYNADLVSSLQMVVRDDDQDLAIAPEVRGKVTLGGTFDLKESLDHLLNGTNYGWVSIDGVIVVASQSRLGSIRANFIQNRVALKGIRDSRISLDLGHVDRHAVCALCAKKLGCTLDDEAPMGLIAVTVSHLSTADALALACSLSDLPIRVTLKGSSIHLK